MHHDRVGRGLDARRGGGEAGRIGGHVCGVGGMMGEPSKRRSRGALIGLPLTTPGLISWLAALPITISLLEEYVLSFQQRRRRRHVCR